MLRVEASNLPGQRTMARSRRLHASSAPGVRRGTSTSRHEILPPASPAAPPPVQLSVPPAPSPTNPERWSVRLDLVDGDIARLYGYGLARGALVWKKGMVEWRPLLITPELNGLLRRTRITLSESSPLPEPSDPVTSPRLPAPARMPSGIPVSSDDSARRVPLTVSPIALDVPAPAPSKRRYDVAAAAVLSFGLAWFAHGSLNPTEPTAAPATSVAAAAAAAPPVAETPREPAPLATSSIPQVALTDLPLLGGKAPAAAADRPASTRVAATSSADGPSRSALVSALSRVAGIANGCGERGGPVRVVITFAGSGVARSIKVSGADLPASTRSCIIGAASRARVPAFTGEPVTVAKTL